MAQNTDFYKTLPVQDHFETITNESLYQHVPDGWSLVITDVKGSTQAIEAGKYKEVNLIGASSIIAVLNASQGQEIPFVFGGDGSTLLVPDAWIPELSSALAATQKMARDQFSLELRVGIVPVKEVHAQGVSIKIAKVRISPNYCQAMFAGGGVSLAEKLVKGPEGEKFRLKEVSTAKADYTGLECRWNDISNKQGETHSLLVMALGENAEANGKIYQQVISEIGKIYGSMEEHHPVSPAFLNLSLSPQRLEKEAKIHGLGRGRISILLSTLKILIKNIIGVFFFARNSKAIGVDWGQYKVDLRANTDYKKFDDMLRMVLAGTPEKRNKLHLFFGRIL